MAFSRGCFFVLSFLGLFIFFLILKILRRGLGKYHILLLVRHACSYEMGKDGNGLRVKGKAHDGGVSILLLDSEAYN